MIRDHRLTPDEVDAKIEEWHAAAENGWDDGTPLHEYLGWTWEEMKRWVKEEVIP